MRKFLVGVTALALLLLGVWYLVYFQGFYLSFGQPAPVSVPVKAAEGKLWVEKNGGYEPFTAKGVAVSSSLPGKEFSDYAAGEETYLRWLEQIREMGANTVLASTILDDDFYNALFRANEGAEEPLYLLQTISVSDYANNSAQDASSSQFLGALLRDAQDAVDVVHGRKIIALNRLRGSGWYQKDVSPWVLGYVVGLEWDSGVIAYTNHRGSIPPDYRGTYLSASAGASGFEALLARVMDRLAAYETEKYRVQHPVSFLNDPKNDPFAYEPAYGRQIGKYNQLDAGHVETEEDFVAGMFASYRLYEFCGGFRNYFSSRQKAELGGVLSGLNTELYYEGYTQLLSEYHAPMPVVVTGYGFSTSRGLTSEIQAETGPLSERRQGERLAETYRDIVTSGCAGAVVSTWQDVWTQRTWNTSFATDLSAISQWHDLQADGQGYGLLAFDPGEEEKVCLVDGDPSEWAAADRVLESGGFSLSVRRDEEALYLLVSGAGISDTSPLYIPLDVTPKTGSLICSRPALSFSRPADFLLCLEGRADGRLLVQERYDALRENYLTELEGKDPFVEIPRADSPMFSPVRMLIVPRDQVVEEAVLEDRRNRGTHLAWETGKLFHGDGNPNSPAYDSRTDFCYGENCVEVRLPWGLLNFSDPSRGKVHDDYYLHYGVENLSVDSIWLGVSGGHGDIPMEEFHLEQWNSIIYHERLKQSYEVLQREWGEG